MTIWFKKASSSLGSGHIIQEEGSSLTQRGTLNFVGGTVTAADDAGNSRTNVTVSAEPPLGFTAENVANKDTDSTMAANSDTKYASQKATKTALALKANLASPALTGHPTGVTESAGDNSTRLASTAYVDTADNLKANLASPTFTGTPAAPTAATQTGTTQLATTAYADVGDALAAWGLPATGITYQSFPRQISNIVATGATLTSGTLKLVAVWLPTGFTVTSITFASGTTALTTAGSGPHFWVALYNSSRALLRQSNDDTAATWAANSLKTVNLSSTFQTTYTGLHYLGLACNCGSTGAMPTLITASNTSSILPGFAPILFGNSTTGITGTAPDPAAALTVGTNMPYCGAA